MLLAQEQRRRRRDRADAQLERGTVGDQVRHVRADPPLHLADRADGSLVGRHVDLDREVDVGHVDEALAEGPRHRAVELDDDRLRVPDRGMHRLHRCAQRAEAVRVRWGGVHEHGVERQRPALEQPWDVGQEHRDVVGAPLVDGLTGVRSDEQRAVAEVAGHLGRQVRPRSFGVQVHDLDVPEVRGSCNECVKQHGRRRCGALEIDALAGADAGNGFLGAGDPHRDRMRARITLHVARRPTGRA